MNYAVRLLLASLLVVTLLLSGCGGLPVGSESGDADAVPPDVSPTEPPPEPPSSIPSSTSDSAVDQLLSEAMSLRDQGDIEGAINVAERALRIAPRNPRVYYVLGTLYLDKGEAGEALQLARKASSLDTDGFYLRSIDRLIADCEAALSYQ
jgi:tetratricopeptide (TPR) repeat protein